MKVLLLDNYDSFTFNLEHSLRDLVEVTVVRNDQLELNDALQFDRILLSPGPGLPGNAGIMPTLVRELSPIRPILGVCLGHQCIAEVFGAQLVNLPVPFHGKATKTKLLTNSDPIFAGLPKTLTTGRYHSWAVRRETLPEEIQVTAMSEEDDCVMAIRHRHYPVWGVQFHPESVLTPEGKRILSNWIHAS